MLKVQQHGVPHKNRYVARVVIEFYSERAALHFIVSLNLGDVDLCYYSEDSYLEQPKL